MAVKKIITSTVPNKLVKHFFQLESVAPISATITDLSRTAFFNENIISLLKFKDALTVRTEVVWTSRAECDANDQQLFTLHPEYVSTRDQYHAQNGITWTITYEEV